MDLLQNPFHILTATPRDSGRKIMQLADERSLLVNSSECMKARLTLTNPRKRLSAEVAWLSGVGPKRAAEIWSLLESSPTALLDIEKLTSSARSNLLAAGLARLPEYTADGVAEWIIEIAWAFENIDAEELRMIINEERIVSGFPEVTDLSAVEAELYERRQHYRQVVKSALNNLSAKELVEAVTLAVEAATNDGNIQGPILIADLIDAYELEAQEFLEKEFQNVRILVERIKSTSNANWSDAQFGMAIEQLKKVIRNWCRIARPIQLSLKSRGLDHDQSIRLAELARVASVHLYIDRNKINLSKHLTEFLLSMFAEVRAVADDVTDDANYLNERKTRTEEWEKEITYGETWGLIFKKSLKISPEGIEWNGERKRLEDIARIRWGSTDHYVNGVYQKSTHIVAWGNAEFQEQISLKREDIYQNFVKRLWMAVAVRLLMDYLRGFGKGKRYKFGSLLVDNKGVFLRKYRFFTYKYVFCPWKQLAITSANGSLMIETKRGGVTGSALSYQAVDNVHILEKAISLMRENGSVQLSDGLKE